MRRVRVATYNIAGATNDDNRVYARRGNASTARRTAHARRALTRIAELLERERVDLVALQEVDVCHNGADTLRQAEFLARALGMSCAYAPSFDYDLLGRVTVTTGVATLARAPVADLRHITFPRARPSWRQRLRARLLGAKRALHTAYRIQGLELHVVNAHLTHDSDAQKALELTTLLDYAAGLPVALLLGDLNTTPSATRGPGMVESRFFGSDGCMELLRDFRLPSGGGLQHDARLGAFVDSPTEIREICTYPSDRTSIKLDYVLLSSRDPAVALGPERILDICTSNHRPVVAELRIQD